MPSLTPYRGSNKPPALRQPGGGRGHQPRPPKPPLAVRAPGLIEGANVVGGAAPKLLRATVYGGLTGAALVYWASLPAFLLWGIAVRMWVIGGLLAITLYELVPFVWAIMSFRMRRRAEDWERQQIHEAQTYGDARQASWVEAHDALRGSPGGHSPPRMFDE